MNLLSISSFFAVVVYLYLGIYALHLDIHSRLNRIFGLLCLSLSVWSFGYAFVYAAPDKPSVWFWFRISSLGWCTFGGISLHFLLVLTRKEKILKQWWLYPLLYVPGLLFFYRSWTDVLTAGDFLWTPLGWTEVIAPEGAWFCLHITNYILCILIGVILTWRWGRSSTIQRERKQARIVVFTILLALVLGTLINVILPILGFRGLPGIAHIVILIWALGIWHAIVEYRLMVLTPSIATDEIISRMKDMLLLTNTEGIVIRVNRRTEELLGYEEKDLLGRPFDAILSGEEIPETNPSVNRALFFKTKTGDSIPVSVSRSAITDRAGDAVGQVIVGQDMRPTRRLQEEILIRQQAEETLKKAHNNLEVLVQERTASLAKTNEALQAEIDVRREAEALFKTLFDKTPIGIFIAQKGIVRMVNPEFRKLTQFSEGELLGMDAFSLVVPEDRPYIIGRIEKMLQGEQARPLEGRIIRKDRKTRWCMGSFSAIRYQGETAILGSLMDITDRKQAEETILQLAYYDTLTGLPNRVLFHDRFTLAVANALRGQKELALMMIDLDRFKEINDTLGHSTGDELLKGVSQRLTGLLRKGDTIARMGGDEFILLLPEMARREDAEIVAAKILKAMQIPFDVEGHRLSVTASIGIAIYPSDGREMDILMKNADQAMYCAKESGRNKYEFYQPTESR
ncbi:MAG: diguanylate cyclase [Deltaproteobacteria bacterium]|nr:diguanylate cyclase [Deltaproteobacteria bacterium]